MKEQDDCRGALYPEQMTRLDDLGADLKRASAYWFKDVDGLHLTFKKVDDRITFGLDSQGNNKYYINDKCAIVPAFTLEDIINYPTGNIIIKLQKGKVSIDKYENGATTHLNGGLHSNTCI